MYIDLHGKNILITGASSGIGRQCAIAASQCGARVILIARNTQRLEETVHQLSDGDHRWFAQDVTQYAQLEALIRQIVSQVGKIFGFVHAAGEEMTLPLRAMQPEYYEALLAVNAISGFELAKILSQKKYLDERGASFVFVASVMAKLGQMGKVAYCSSKGALLAGSKALALELAAKRIRVNCVLPGIIKTEMTAKMFAELPEESLQAIKAMHPLGFGEPEDVANACVFLLSDAAKWMTGAELVIDGGYSIA